MEPIQVRQLPGGHTEIFCTVEHLQKMAGDLAVQEVRSFYTKEAYVEKYGTWPEQSFSATLRSADGRVIRFRPLGEIEDGILPEPSVYSADMPQGALE